MTRVRLYLWGCVCIVMTLLLQIYTWTEANPGTVIIQNIDILSILFILILQGVFLCISGSFFRTIRFFIHPEEFKSNDIWVMKGLQRVAYGAAIIIVTVNCYMSLMTYWSDRPTLQWHIAWSFLPVLYATIIYLFWLPLEIVAKSDGDKKNLD